jgi:hypothetical protein
METLERIYTTSNIVLLPVWLLLIFAPGWRWTDRIVNRLWIPLLYCMSVTLILLIRPASPAGASIGSLSGFMLMLNEPTTALMIWIQLVIWDLFIGAWMARDARRHGIHWGWMVVPMLVIYIFGPPGLLLYFGLRFAKRRTITLDENVALGMDWGTYGAPMTASTTSSAGSRFEK